MTRIFLQERKKAPTDWTIVLAERPVMISRQFDVARFGKPFSHPFLVLKSPSDHVISEIHYSWKRGTPLENQISKTFDRLTGRIGSEHVNAFMRAAARGLYPHMEAYLTRGTQQYDRAVAEQVLFAGPITKTRALWQAIVDTFDETNAARDAYYRYARRGSGFANCQIKLRDALSFVSDGLARPVPALRLAQTGWTEPVKPAITLP